METKKTIEEKAFAVKITIESDGIVWGRARLYIMYNDLHLKPFGFMEDVFVEENKRGQGLGKRLVQAVIDEAKERGCYKMICTSRHAKTEVHKLYEGFGFKNHGLEFRIDL